MSWNEYIDLKIRLESGTLSRHSWLSWWQTWTKKLASYGTKNSYDCWIAWSQYNRMPEAERITSAIFPWQKGNQKRNI